MSEQTMYLKVPPTAADEMAATIFDPLSADGLTDPEHEEHTERIAALWEAWQERRRFQYGIRLELTPKAAARLLWDLASTQGIIEVQATSSYDIRDNARGAARLQAWRRMRRDLREWLTEEVGAKIEGRGFGSLPAVRFPADAEDGRE